jgi:hypothetical protein
MKAVLTAICLVVLALMLYVTISATLQQDIVSATRQLWAAAWFRATLADAYCGFLFFWLWVAWREQSAAKGALWFVLIMTLGNLAMASYILLQLRRLPAGASVVDLLKRREVVRT